MKHPSKILAEGREFQIHVEKREFDPLPSHIEQRVEELWIEQKKFDPDIPNTSMLLAHNAWRDGNILRLICGSSSRKYFTGTTNEDIVALDGGRYIRRSVSMLAITRTADNCVVLGVRTPKTGYPLLRHAVPAGRLQVNELDPVNGIFVEYKEELGLERHEVYDLTCIGLVADLVYGFMCYEFIFIARSKLTACQLMERALTAISANEHCVLEAFPWDPDFIRENVLLMEPTCLPPTGFAGLNLALRHDFGTQAGIPEWEPAPCSYKEFMGRRWPMMQKISK